jgi:hypothetical protein
MARAGLAAFKVAPTAREAGLSGSAVPSEAFAVCAVNAELFTAVVTGAVIGEAVFGKTWNRGSSITIPEATGA